MAAEAELAQRLIERLLSDPAFRAEFRRDPEGAARRAGLAELVDGGDPLQTLGFRESRSSLAGVAMAAAVEGLGIADVAQAAGGGGGHAVHEHLDPDRYGMQGTGGTPDAETLALLRNRHVTFDADGIADLKAGRIDPRVVSVLTELSRQHDVTISAMCSDHPKLTAGGSISNHYYGRALDVATVDGQPVGPGNAAARKLAIALGHLPASIRPTEIGSPWQLSGPAYFSDAAHQNHLHIGFDDPIGSTWRPPAGVVESAPAAEPGQGDGGDAPDHGTDGASEGGDDTRGSDADDSGGDGDDSGGDDDGDGGDVREDGGSGDTEAEADDESASEGDDDDEEDDDADDGAEDEGDDEDEDEDEPDEVGPDQDDLTDDEVVGDGDDGDDGGDADGGGDGDGGAAGDSSDRWEDPGASLDDYPGDDAGREELAAWMAGAARKRGLPPELPIMAALVESGLTNLDYGDADSVGFFQMRLGIWNQGDYVGYPDQPETQVDWFLDHAEAVKQQRVAQGLPVDDPAHYGEWIADVERPAAQYRDRYQPMLAAARELLERAGAGSGRAHAASDPSSAVQRLRIISPEEARQAAAERPGR